MGERSDAGAEREHGDLTRAVIAVVVRDGPASARKVAEALPWANAATVGSLLSALATEGRIERVGRGRYEGC